MVGGIEQRLWILSLLGAIQELEFRNCTQLNYVSLGDEKCRSWHFRNCWQLKGNATLWFQDDTDFWKIPIYMLGGKRTETLQQRSGIEIRIHSHILFPMRQEVQILAFLTLLQGILLRKFKIIQISEGCWLYEDLEFCIWWARAIP